MTLAHWIRRSAFISLLIALCLSVSSCGPRSGQVSVRLPRLSWNPPTMRDVKATLTGTTFRRFVDESDRILLLRFPQTVTEQGLASQLGVRNDRLDDLSSRYLEENAAIEREILDRLHAYSRESLSAEDQAICDARDAAWTTLLAQQDAPPAIQAFGPGDESWNQRLIRRFAAVAEIDTEGGLVDYIQCLHQAARQVNQMRTWLEQGVKRGTLPSRADLTAALVSMSQLRVRETWSTSEYLPDRIIAAHHPFFALLRDQVVDADFLDAATRTAYLNNANRVVEREIIPAYERLANYLAQLLNKLGVS